MENKRIQKIEEYIKIFLRGIEEDSVKLSFYNLDDEFEPYEIIKLEDKIHNMKKDLKRLKELLEKESHGK